jgi:hypothetical protein
MASRPWADEDRAFLETLAGRRDWIGIAMERFTDRTEAAVRCMMQKVREEQGSTERRFMESAWMADAVNGTRMLGERLNSLGLRPQ